MQVVLEELGHRLQQLPLRAHPAEQAPALVVGHRRPGLAAHRLLVRPHRRRVPGEPRPPALEGVARLVADRGRGQLGVEPGLEGRVAAHLLEQGRCHPVGEPAGQVQGERGRQPVDDGRLVVRTGRRRRAGVGRAGRWARPACACGAGRCARASRCASCGPCSGATSASASASASPPRRPQQPRRAPARPRAPPDRPRRRARPRGGPARMQGAASRTGSWGFSLGRWWGLRAPPTGERGSARPGGGSGSARRRAVRCLLRLARGPGGCGGNGWRAPIGRAGGLTRLVGGAEGIRTPDPLVANEVRYQLRHSPLSRPETRAETVAAGTGASESTVRPSGPTRGSRGSAARSRATCGRPA